MRHPDFLQLCELPSADRFPFDEPLQIGDRQVTASHALELLSPALTAARIQRIRDVVAQRTFDVAVVLDQIGDSGNRSAVIRTAEAYGFANLHDIESQSDLKTAKRVTRGADKWVEITSWSTPGDCARHLKRQGFQIVVTSLAGADRLEQLDVQQPVAIAFGNEHRGVSDDLEQQADLVLQLPMVGFVESFNISVAAAICLTDLYHRRRQALDSSTFLTGEQRQLLRAVYTARSIRNAADYLSAVIQRREIHGKPT